jgi:hypothetical protein
MLSPMPESRSAFARQCARIPLAAMLVLAAVAGCGNARHADTTPLDQGGVYFKGVERLRQLKISDAEVQQLVAARAAGLDDDGSIELVRIARTRQQPFAAGDTVAGLLGAGFKQGSVLTLARLGQLESWAGEAQALHLSRLSDDVILSVAKRRAAGQPVLSTRKIVDLQNVGLSQTELIAEINRGATDTEADDIIMRRNYYAGGHTFVHQRGMRRR